MRIARFLTVGLFLVCAPAPALELSISVTEPAGVARRAEVVSGGIPLPQGKYKDPGGFSLYDGDAEVPVQVSPIVNYPDGSLHWALVSFPATLDASAKKTYTLKDAPGKAAPQNPVAVEERGTKVIISNGLVSVTVDKDAFNGIESLTLKGQEVFRAAKAGLTAGGKGGPAKPTHFEFRYLGPLLTTLYVKGVYGDLKTPTWSMTITLCAGEPRIHVEHNLRNGGVGVDSINVDSAKMRFGAAGVFAAAKSGGKPPAFGWQQFTGPGEPMLFVRHGGGARAADIKYNIAFSEGEIVVDQSLTGGPIHLPEGTHKITEIDILLGGSAEMGSLAGPLHALAPSAWYSEHDGLGVGKGFASLADETAAYKAMDWKDAENPKKLPGGGNHQPELYRSWMDVHGTTECDQIRGLTVQYVRTGQRGFLDRATAWNRLHRTRYLWRTDDFTFGKEGSRRVAKWGGDRWCNCHAYGVGLFNYALLTGHIDTLEAAFDAAEHANAVYGTYSKTKPGANFSWWGSRPFARLYEIVGRAYDVARTPEWRAALVHFVNVATKTDQRDPRGFTNHGVISTWTKEKLDEFRKPGGSPAAVDLFEKEGTEILDGGRCKHPKYGEWQPKCVGTWPEAIEGMANLVAAQVLAESDDPDAQLAAEDAMDYAIAEAYFGVRYAFDPVQKCVYYYIFLDFPIPDYVPNWKGGKWDTYQASGTDSWYTKWWPSTIAAGYVLTGDEMLRRKAMEVLWWGLSRTYIHPPTVPENTTPPYASISESTKDDSVSTTVLALGIGAHAKEDREPPAAVRDLVARALGDGKVELSWTEPAGQPVRFQVKHDAKPVKDYLDVNYRDERNSVTYWNIATNVLGEPTPTGPGAKHRMTLIVPVGTRHFALRSFDAAHNRSAISNVASVEVK